MTDPIAYIDGQLDVYEVLALIEEAAEAALQADLAAETEWTTEDEDEYLAGCKGYILSEMDEILDPEPGDGWWM
jgi:hypothetical protein